MIYPIDIHTHRNAVRNGLAIVNCFPNQFMPEGENWYSVGVHPWYISDTTSMDWTIFEDLIRHPQVLALGEAGLDKLAQTPFSVQEEVFGKQAIYAEQVKKPLIIHLVKAVDELLRWKRELQPVQPWIIHGFRGKAVLAETLLRHGCYLSFGMRFQEAALCTVPIERLFLETDESVQDVYGLYQQVAQLRGCSCEELFESVNRNIKHVFFKQ